MDVVSLLSELRDERQRILFAIRNLELAAKTATRFRPIPIDFARRRQTVKPTTPPKGRTPSPIFPRSGQFGPK